ncbi:squalene epoxidase-domain-containing protein [Sphaerosporella brunnea]|uniref:Squalene monooxygenase n=1 Tax=Sphaerosporella brunnea TaxID=1250544 RepID=A0A5J5ECR3_9PEZI|nr:squalene epoxidase-domain-containing protein [Sphaerosporella brunnea]
MSPQPHETTHDVVIVGAGIMGCALAVAFGNQGRRVLVLERDLSEPDRIVGELLQPGGVEALEKLGMRDCLEDIDAIPVYGYETIYHGEPVTIPYPWTSAGKKAEGRAFHHGKFVQKLRAAARRTPNVTLLEATAKDILRDEASLQVLGVLATEKSSKTTHTYRGKLTVSADGYASNFRKRCTTRKPVVRSTFVGLQLIDVKLPSPNHGHIIMGNNPPVLLYQIGTHETRALVDMPSLPPSGQLKPYLLEIVAPDLPAQVQPAFRKAVEAADRLPSMPNSFLPAQANDTPGMILLGDAMNMRHPLTGGGMTVAFNDAYLLSHLLSPSIVPDFADTTAVLEQMRLFHWDRKSLSGVVNILAQALYALFAADDSRLRVLQMGCFIGHAGQPVGGLDGLRKAGWTWFQLAGGRQRRHIHQCARLVRADLVQEHWRVVSHDDVPVVWAGEASRR